MTMARVRGKEVKRETTLLAFTSEILITGKLYTVAQGAVARDRLQSLCVSCHVVPLDNLTQLTNLLVKAKSRGT